jgi:predicted small secreted protein
MKKSILVFSAFALMTAATLTSCNSPAKKVEEAQNDVNEANKDLAKANEAYLADIESYRKETAEKIAANDRSIAEFNSRIKEQKREAAADYKMKIAKLEQKNSDMKKHLDDYKAEGKENWQKFKTEFNHDMEERGKAFKDLTVKNVK